MTLSERITRARWCLDSIEAKHGAHESGPLRVAVVDALRLAEDAAHIVAELARRIGKGER